MLRLSGTTRASSLPAQLRADIDNEVTAEIETATGTGIGIGAREDEWDQLASKMGLRQTAPMGNLESMGRQICRRRDVDRTDVVLAAEISVPPRYSE